MSKTAEIRNIGPIERILIPVPADGGVIVFRGKNGVGKTHALQAIDRTLSGRGDRLPIRDGQLKAVVEGWGVKLTIGKSTSRIGEAEVHSLEGKLDVSAVVDPGIKDPEKADAQRIRALVALVGAAPDPALFLPLFGSQANFDRIVNPSSLTHSDLVALAGAIKRDLEAASRKAAAEATNAEARADAARKAAEGVDLEAPTDAKALQGELEAAIGEKSRLEASGAAAVTALRHAEAAKTALARATATYKGQTIDDAHAALENAKVEADAACKAVGEAERALQAARARSSEASAKRDQCVISLEAAHHHVNLTAEWQEQIDAAANVFPINPGDLVRAASAVDQCRQRVETGAVVRRAKAQLAEAEQFDRAKATHSAEAEALRDAARAVDNVLSDVVSRAGVPLRVEPVNLALRLTTETNRGRTCFGELSDGERWRIALDIAIKAVGAGGELTIGQAGWQDLDSANRAAIAERAREAGVLIYTAQADEGELRAEIFNGKN